MNDLKNKIIVYTDGACRGNPGPGGYGAVIAWPSGSVQEFGGGVEETTNNEMELRALLCALEQLQGCREAMVFFIDSKYVLEGVSKWVYGWEKNGWVTSLGEPVSHSILWRKILTITKNLSRLTYHHLPSHVGIPGNERVDQIASQFADKTTPTLYNGSLETYSFDLFDLNPKKEKKKSSSSSVKAYSYLSLVNGEVKRHTTWAECEARVKGRSGVKYKKAVSQEDETAILNSWGVSLR